MNTRPHEQIPVVIEPFSIFEECERELAHYKGDIRLAVDIGAHQGSMSWLLAERGATVLAFEPFYFDDLCKNIDKTFGRQRIVPFPFAVSRTSSFSLGIKIGREPGEVSLLLKESESVGKKSVHLFSFEDIMSIAGQVDYLKVDCEGAEYTFLIPAKKTTGLLEGVKYLHIEIHGCELFDLKYSDAYLSAKYQKLGVRRDQTMIDWLQTIFDLREICTEPGRRVLVGPHR